MLRITKVDGPERIILKLEGRLMGPWVEELALYKNRLACLPQNHLLVDLGGVTFVDEEGKTLLKQMWRQGAELVAMECWMEAVVEDITKGTR